MVSFTDVLEPCLSRTTKYHMSDMTDSGFLKADTGALWREAASILGQYYTKPPQLPLLVSDYADSLG